LFVAFAFRLGFGLFFLLLIVCFRHASLRVLAFRRGLLFARDGFSRPFSRPGIRVSSLPSHWQILAMTQSSIGAHVEMPLDVGRDFAPQIAFDLLGLVDDLTDLYDIVIGQAVRLEIERNSGFSKYFPRRAPPDTINIRERHFHSLITGKIHSGNSCHTLLQ
jgi:hypothetical protein